MKKRKIYTSINKCTHIYIQKKQEETSIKIKQGGIKYSKEGKVLHRTELNGTGNCFITLKNDKTNLINNPITRLIKPAKNDIVRISKEILDRINSLLCSNFKVNTWKNTISLITQLRKIKDKHLYKFSIFNIKNFYPSIKENSFHSALRFAKIHANIT